MPTVSRQSFFVGGTYAGPPEDRVMHGQMYVEMLKPARAAHPYPLVLIHGLGQTAMNWLSTPDGSQGWAEWFAEHGWDVCIVDQPARGRSAWQPELDGTLKTISAALTEELFTAPEVYVAWPQARRHTQWPGEGRVGDPVFDQFYASQVPVARQCRERKAHAGSGHCVVGSYRSGHSRCPFTGGFVRLAHRRLATASRQRHRGARTGGAPLQGHPIPNWFGSALGLTSLPLTVRSAGDRRSAVGVRAANRARWVGSGAVLDAKRLTAAAEEFGRHSRPGGNHGGVLSRDV